ncbi:hypothetical protein Fmac_018109 [Flemingia macrophylla]|uniref:Uncharacterized protein n=1 Tax=Flemingia macrophylla TaxID=520843 RepID=A0ABD1M4P8_9FABA
MTMMMTSSISEESSHVFPRFTEKAVRDFQTNIQIVIRFRRQAADASSKVLSDVDVPDAIEAWLWCKGNYKNRLSRSVTDENIDELKACIELGFGFDSSPVDGNRHLSDTLPVLGLYCAVNKCYNDAVLLRLQQHFLPFGSPHSSTFTTGN